MMLPSMEQAERWVEQAQERPAAIAQISLWERTDRLYDGGVPDAWSGKRMARWLNAACALLKAQDKQIILTDYPAQEVPWHVLGMQLTMAACVGEVSSACGELLKWCDANGVPLCEAMEWL